MKRQNINICILRIEGTNNEQEMYDAFKRLETSPKLVHLNEVADLDKYHCLMIPGGFSAGDYVRAGAILASRIKSRCWDKLLAFIKDGYPVGGICNGFQVLVELGLLPGFNGEMGKVKVCLSQNDSSRFECRHTILKHISSKKCVFTKKIPEGEILTLPSAHAEGKLLAAQQSGVYKKLQKNGQIVFKYCDENGDISAPYPWNPNGSPHNIAGICSESGNVFGMMPHPERAFFTQNKNGFSGKSIFESVVEYMEDAF
ncbi:MAG: phosphoribosylformylglycinamidine synthase subunit PurQ [Candidatus Methanofastidiosia archaeon]